MSPMIFLRRVGTKTPVHGGALVQPHQYRDGGRWVAVKPECVKTVERDVNHSHPEFPGGFAWVTVELTAGHIEHWCVTMANVPVEWRVDAEAS